MWERVESFKNNGRSNLVKFFLNFELGIGYSFLSKIFTFFPTKKESVALILGYINLWKKLLEDFGWESLELFFEHEYLEHN